MATTWATEGSAFKSGQSQEFSLLHVVQTGCGAHPGPWVPGVKWPEREADHHLQLLLRSRKGGSIHPLPHRYSWGSA
jgi:hypothetical protein